MRAQLSTPTQIFAKYLVSFCIILAVAADETAAELVLKARELAKQPGGAKKADEMLGRAAALDPTNGEALMYRANIEAFLTKQSMPRAIKLFRESIAIDGGKRYEAYFFLGKVLNGEKRFTEAADALRAASKLVPDNQAVLQELASATARMSIPVDAHGKAVAELPDDEQLAAALAKNLQEHHKESLASCETFYCAPESASSDEATGDAYQPPPMAGYPMGPVPSNDFPAAFENRSDEQNTQIYVSEVPIFSLEECEKVISLAESDGKLQAATSGKYTIGRAWIKEMPTVLAWFNEVCARLSTHDLLHASCSTAYDPHMTHRLYHRSLCGCCCHPPLRASGSKDEALPDAPPPLRRARLAPRAAARAHRAHRQVQCLRHDRPERRACGRCVARAHDRPLPA